MELTTITLSLTRFAPGIEASLLLEDGFHILLESGDYLLLE